LSCHDAVLAGMTPASVRTNIHANAIARLRGVEPDLFDRPPVDPRSRAATTGIGWPRSVHAGVRPQEIPDRLRSRSVMPKRNSWENPPERSGNLRDQRVLDQEDHQRLNATDASATSTEATWLPAG